MTKREYILHILQALEKNIFFENLKQIVMYLNADHAFIHILFDFLKTEIQQFNKLNSQEKIQKSVQFLKNIPQENTSKELKSLLKQMDVWV